VSWSLDGRPIRKVLVTRLRYLGDIVMSTVVLDALKAGDPDLQIDYLCESGFGEVLEDHPQLGEVHLLDTRRRGSDSEARVRIMGDQRALGTRDMIRRLRARKYDLAVDLFFNPRSAWLLRLAGIPRRIGGTSKWRRRLYTHSVLRDDPRCRDPKFPLLASGGLADHLCRLAPLTHGDHGTDFMTWLMHQYEPGDLYPDIARPRLDSLGRKALQALPCDPTQPYLLAAPGATWPTKQWPVSRWVEFLEGCLARTTLPVAVLLPPGKEDQWEELRGVLPAGRGGLLPALPLKSALSVVGASSGLVSADGGIMHASAAMGVPTVAIFGPTDPLIWFPYSSRPTARVAATRPPCHPCDLHECPDFICLPDLGPEPVLDMLDEVLSTPKGGLA